MHAHLRGETWKGFVIEFTGKVALVTGAGSGIGKATAEQVGQLVLFLASDAASQITGTEVWIDGGSSLITG